MLTFEELFFVLLIALAVFRLARPVASLFTAADDLARRRTIWCVVTAAAFLCPEFWLFCLVAMPFLIWAARKDSNPGALYVVLIFIVPEYSWRVPLWGSSFLFNLDFALLLSLCVMAPAALRLYKSQQQPSAHRALDLCLLAYLLLSSFYFILPEIGRGVLMTPTFTDCLRRVFESFFLYYVPYYVFSRSGSSRREVLDILAAFCLICAVMAAIGAFEGAKHWLLYGEMRSHWGPEYNPYLMRGNNVRAMASTTHPLLFGYLLAVAFGLWLGLQSKVQSRLSRVAVSALYWLGMLASWSRGPWVGAIVIYAIHLALGQRALSHMVKAFGTVALIGMVVAMTPLGSRIAQVIPYFGGTVDVENIGYRERLVEHAWPIIMDSPILGDQRALLKLEELRQGQGIIDVINGYIGVLLSTGFAGLSLFLSFVLIGLVKAWTLSRRRAGDGVELDAIGTGLTACIIGGLVMMWTCGLNITIACLLVGLAAAGTELARFPLRAAMTPAAAPNR